MGTAKFMTQVVNKHFPGQVKGMYLFNLPWMLKPLVSLLGALMPGVKVCDLDEIAEEIGQELVSAFK